MVRIFIHCASLPDTVVHSNNDSMYTIMYCFILLAQFFILQCQLYVWAYLFYCIGWFLNYLNWYTCTDCPEAHSSREHPSKSGCSTSSFKINKNSPHCDIMGKLTKICKLFTNNDILNERKYDQFPSEMKNKFTWPWRCFEMISRP